MDNESGVHFTESEQALIDGVEFGIDYGLEIALENLAEYHRLTGSSCMLLREKQEVIV